MTVPSVLERFPFSSDLISTIMSNHMQKYTFLMLFTDA
ncbi:hypothetical protein BLGI_4164 [Brevibacillus laterosporus GI-9]|nr:hypothetical protein BLGI_4164 [Brevibacillus laterosporus GI-9]